MSTSAHLTARFDALDGEDKASILQQLRERGGYYFPSTKMQCSVPCLTILHRDLACHLELDSSIRAFRAHPERVSYVCDGQTKTHIPAFLARSERHTFIIDAESDLHKLPCVRRSQVTLLTEFYRERRMAYHVVSAPFVHRPPVFPNIEALLAARSFEPPAGDVSAVIQTLSRSGSMTVGQVETQMAGRAHVRATICALVWQQKLDVDLTAREPSEMRLSLRKEQVA